MNVVIYGIDENDFRCGGCLEAKRILDGLDISYEFKRIIKRKDNFPDYDKELLAELSKRIKYTTLLLPYIFIDDEMVKISKLKQFLSDKGYDTEDL